MGIKGRANLEPQKSTQLSRSRRIRERQVCGTKTSSCLPA
jgi:hypothetical protein